MFAEHPKFSAQLLNPLSIYLQKKCVAQQIKVDVKLRQSIFQRPQLLNLNKSL